MRHWLLIAIAIVLSGCSWNTYLSSRHKNVLRDGTPRVAVLAELGMPTSTRLTRVASGERIRTDTYRTREIFPDPGMATGAGMIGGMTYYMSELLLAPYALINHHIRRIRLFRIDYDHDDRLTGYWLLASKS